ncbi:MAG: ATP-dependent ligase [Noviherbaspirillum sp.]|nr:ATP-dependent ligase [Noviherbaspirillum sp.]
MREFARLYAELDETTSTSRKIEAMKNYFSRADPENAAWAVYFLAGGKPRQAVPTKLLRQFAIEYAGIDDWLFDECYHAVGDFAETIAHLLPAPKHQSDIGLAAWMLERIAPLRGASPEQIRAAMFDYWDQLDPPQRFLLLKLIGGGLRVGVSRLLVTRALGEVAGVDGKLIAQRLMGWTDGKVSPSGEQFTRLLQAHSAQEHSMRGGQPYPFFLAHQLQGEPRSLGPIEEWQAEWKYDGIRAQLVRRGGQTWLWSRGEDLITDRFPEIAGISLPDGTVVDGEILIWKNGAPAPFAALQQRIGRKTLSANMLGELPAVLVAYDVLEADGVDMRDASQAQRRQLLEQLVAVTGVSALKLSPLVVANSWDELAALRETSRGRFVEGLMLKGVGSRYGVGRTKDSGTWWKWKIDPYSVDAVLVYAQGGNGRRASLFTDYTFAVWDEEENGMRRLVPFAKAYSGLTDQEIREVDAAIRRTTVETFGPVRSVQPTMVFEIGFEGIARSPRHKSGIAVRFPRILRRRADKAVEDADSLDTLKALLNA